VVSRAFSRIGVLEKGIWIGTIISHGILGLLIGKCGFGANVAALFALFLCRSFDEKLRAGMSCTADDSSWSDNGVRADSAFAFCRSDEKSRADLSFGKGVPGVIGCGSPLCPCMLVSVGGDGGAWRRGVAGPVSRGKGNLAVVDVIRWQMLCLRVPVAHLVIRSTTCRAAKTPQASSRCVAHIQAIFYK
jgi:hypothetical protein